MLHRLPEWRPSNQDQNSIHKRSGKFSGPLVYFDQLDSFEVSVPEMIENNLRGFSSSGVM